MTRHHLAGISIAAFLTTLATPGLAQEQKFKAVWVKTPDGLKIAAQDWGNPNDSNLIAAKYTAKMIPGAKLSVYQGIGHAPFFEDAPRFNAELAAFVRSAQK